MKPPTSILPATRTLDDAQTASAGATNAVTVYFDGGCPLCQREIAMYRQCRGADSIAWVDLSNSKTPEVAPDLSRQAALSRLHVRRSNGQLVSGAVAFSEIWLEMERFRLLGRIMKLPGLINIAEFAYQGFLKFRPLLQSSLIRYLDRRKRQRRH